jgi:periplasmic protein TonB
MRDPFSRNFYLARSSSRDSLVCRIRDNFQQLFTPARIFPSSANGAPLHLLTHKGTSFASAPRVTSFLTHAVLVAGLLLLHAQTTTQKGRESGPETAPRGPFTFFPVPDANLFGHPSLGKRSGGGEEDSRPARRGLLAPPSSMPIVPPRRVVEIAPVLVVPSAVFDPNAPQSPSPVTDLGLPWMKNNSDSAGPGKNHGFGSGKDGGMGDDHGPGAGQGESYNGPYVNVSTLPRCVYCPDPQYTDEAREAKLQGKVSLRVLVGADGRIAQVQMLQGIGMGLDERAAETVRTWKFVPARDAARRNVAAWVTIEVIFRLI